MSFLFEQLFLLHRVLIYLVTYDPNIKMSDMPFAEDLSNPCILVNAFPKINSTRNQIINTRRELLEMLKTKKVPDLKREILQAANRLDFCAKLQFDPIATIPSSRQNITEAEKVELLRSFRTSLLQHKAHMLFVTEEIKNHLYDYTCQSGDLFNNLKSLAGKLKSVICDIHFYIFFSNTENDENAVFRNSTNEIGKEILPDLSHCSRRTLRACRTLKSSITLLENLSSHLLSIP